MNTRMNTVGDIFELQYTAQTLMERNGLCGVEELVGRFNSRMRTLITMAYMFLCLKDEQQAKLQKEDLPPLQVMTVTLNSLEPWVKLPRKVQAHYYAAVAVFITLGTEKNPVDLLDSEIERADVLINSKLLAAAE